MIHKNYNEGNKFSLFITHIISREIMQWPLDNLLELMKIQILKKINI